jgi:hypothetical protein
MDTPKPGTEHKLGYYVVGFFDLLGQQERLRGLRQLPNKDNPAEIDAARQTLRQTWGAVQALRELYTRAFAAFEKRTDDDRVRQGFTQTQIQAAHQLTSNAICVGGFSDSLIAYVSLNTENATLPAKGIFGILAATAMTYHWCLANGHPLRGGIDVGLGIELGPNEIYGPVLSRAYSLESDIAGYPRIVIGDELISYLHALQSLTTLLTTCLELGRWSLRPALSASPRTKTVCRSLITLDPIS